ncbi:MAG: hypothetical protein H6576_14240 [Lewinellaceae bacterium]|nr:hypothetical protein [Lewinellaceae bacterium]
MKISRIIFAIILLIASTATTPSCSKKSGCPATDSLKPKTNKDGTYKKSKGSSELFSKKMRKKMK